MSHVLSGQHLRCFRPEKRSRDEFEYLRVRGQEGSYVVKCEEIRADGALMGNVLVAGKQAVRNKWGHGSSAKGDRIG